ncbi:HD-GYP domain-containing protein [Bacillus sp. AFS041924]|uniref:HD-GYP domain-containing protein n=1 Tax=Bacillus sp. AFS041924 TaxID=2033503 RepID=UPI0020D26648|nr:HD-GYP domain-containing protein [Bacillus sp. AFS041924]
MELILALAKALDSRDKYTVHHSECVANIAYNIAKKMKLSKGLCTVIHQGGLLHDIGKIGIPEHILLKNEKLTDEEYNTIKQHPVIGYDIIKHIAIFNENGIFDIVLYHHERYDGKGYPEGLKGEQIPLTARIVAIADSYDAMISNRSYRKGMPVEECLKDIEKFKGIQFDPKIMDVFLSLFNSENEIIQKK